MGNTSVLCTVHGPAQEERGGRAEGAGGGANGASVEVELNIAGFSGVDRKRVGRNDKFVLSPSTLPNLSMKKTKS